MLKVRHRRRQAIVHRQPQPEARPTQSISPSHIGMGFFTTVSKDPLTQALHNRQIPNLPPDHFGAISVFARLPGMRQLWPAFQNRPIKQAPQRKTAALDNATLHLNT